MNIIEFGDCRTTMRRWAALGFKAQMCVTSPPYFGLRDYGHSGQLGLEPTPDEYVANMVDVFRCVRDLLADDGTLWLNLGDSYASGGRKSRDPGQSKIHPAYGGEAFADGLRPADPPGIKPKDLLGIPWRVAFALQADGWYLRQDIIWSKPNPMPESVTDRCTKAHEYIFMLSKSARYYYDSEAVKEPAVGGTSRGNGQRLAEQAISRTGGIISGGTAKSTLGTSADETRNRRSVWNVATRPYKGAHFATFPPKLIEPCILAGAPAGGIVLDPFMGSGTTAQVALEHGRQYMGCELNPEYAALQQERLGPSC